MRSAVSALFAVVLTGLVVLLLLGASEKRDLAFTLGVLHQEQAALLEPGDELCQGPVDAPESFQAVRLQVGTFQRPGQPLRVDLRGPGSGAVGHVRAGYADNALLTVPVGEVMRDSRFDVCVTNEGSREIGLYGSGALASRSSSARLNGAAIDKDAAIDFVRGESASVLSLAPEMAERASLFHGAWIGSWTIWLLAGLVVAGVPVLLALALRASARCES